MSTMRYQEIAEKYGLKINTVRVYASTDPTFPKSQDTSGHYREFDSDEVDAWMKNRAKGRKGAGRPARGAQPRASASREDLTRLQKAMSKRGITTQDLATALGISWGTCYRRLDGRLRWKRDEVLKAQQLIGSHPTLTHLLEQLPEIPDAS